MSAPFAYQGQELEVFEHAHGWKRYWQAAVKPWIRGGVLEVGAGLGVNTRGLQSDAVGYWHCLEPDAELARQLAQRVQDVPRCSVFTGTIADRAGSQYDTILYVDVLEHIEADRAELLAAAKTLRAGGHIIVLAPAHQFLFSEFDAAIGHYRRYDKASLRECSPPGCLLVDMFYLDSAGLLASLANRLFLRQNLPTVRQIKTWDRFIVPMSRVLDPVLLRSLGKTIVAVWRNVAAQ